ncbi:hypothetical protein CCP1ISM_7350001 [Azospirillaceae bacterium]
MRGVTGGFVDWEWVVERDDELLLVCIVVLLDGRAVEWRVGVEIEIEVPKLVAWKDVVDREGVVVIRLANSDSSTASRSSSFGSTRQILTVWSLEQVARSLISGLRSRRVRYSLCALNTRQGARLVSLFSWYMRQM